MKTKDNLRKCFASQCDFCREGCASYVAFNLDSYGPRGKNRILQAYHDGRLDLSDMVNLAFRCMACGQCEEVCITGDGIHSTILELRTELVRKGLAPKQIHDLSNKIKKTGSAFDYKNIDWAKNRHGKGGVGYFPGCGLMAFNPDLAEKTLDVLEGFGIRAAPITGWCCSSPLLRTGLVREAKKVAELLHRELVANRIRTLICSCPGCALTLKEECGNLVKGWNVKVKHISEILVRKKKECGRKRGRKIMYHDPCHLARGLDITSEPRSILKALGHDVLEFHKSERKSLCCGGGGGAAMLHPDGAQAVAESKVKEALDADAELLVSFCPLCEHILERAAKGRIEVKDILELF